MGSELVYSSKISYYDNLISYAQSNNITLPYSSFLTPLKTLLDQLGDAGILDKLDLFYIFAGRNYDESYDYDVIPFKLINIVNPGTYNATAIGDYLHFFTRHVYASEEENYFDTNFNPSLLTADQKYLQDNASRGAYISRSTYGAIDGCSVANMNVLMNSSSNKHRINSSSDLSSSVNLSGTGFRAIVRNSSTDVSLYAGSSKSSATQNSAAMTNSNQFIFRSGTSYRTQMYLSCYFMGAELLDSEVVTFNNSFSEYFQQLPQS